MTYPFPVRTSGDSAQLHVNDHNELHSRLGQALPTGLTTGTLTGHLSHQNQIHLILNTILAQSLPTGLTSSSTGHLDHHNAIGTLLNDEIWGPEGTLGPQNLTGHPLYPGAFTQTISTASPGGSAAAIQTAVNTPGGTFRKFRIMPGTYNITSTIIPHAGDELWFDNGAVVANGGAVLDGIKAQGVDDIKIMGATVRGFTTSLGVGVKFTDCSSVEIGYCDLFNNWKNVACSHGGSTFSTGIFVHHNWSHDALDGGVFSGQRLEDAVWEHNEWGPTSVNAAAKLLGQKGCKWRHNYSHSVGTGIWFDTASTDCLVEWNEITDTGVFGQMGAVCFEICYYEENSASTIPITEATKNICRYNYIHDNYNPGILIRTSSWVEVYGNIFYHNGATVDQGEVTLTRDGNLQQSGQPMDTHNNYIHHNMITPTASNRKAARLNVINTPDLDPYFVTNTKNNNWNFNTYDNLSGSQFDWPAPSTHLTFSQWQTIPQGPAGTGAFQDINGSSV